MCFDLQANLRADVPCILLIQSCEDKRCSRICKFETKLGIVKESEVSINTLCLFQVHWMMYWIAYAVFSVVEVFADTFLGCW